MEHHSLIQRHGRLQLVPVVTILFTLLMDCRFAHSSQDVSPDSPIKSAALAKSLPHSEAENKRLIHLRGIVTAVPEGWKGFFLEDETGGIYCEPENVEAERAFWPVRVGEELELHGLTVPGHRNSFVAVSRIVSRTRGDMPQPALRTLSSILLDRVDADFVRVRGHIVDLVNIAGEMEYGLAGNGIEAEVIHAGFRIDPKVYEHSEVEISGVVIPQEGNTRPIKIVVPNSDCFRMLATHLEVKESTELTPIATVLHHSLSHGRVVRISGDVYCRESDDIWLVENGFGIKCNAIDHLLPNGTKHVKLLGLLHDTPSNRTIKYAAVLSTSKSPSGYLSPTNTIADVSNHINQIVTVKAILWDSNLINSENILSFDLGSTKLTCRILETEPPDVSFGFQRGAEYSITGLLTPDSMGIPGSSTVVVNSLANVRMVSGPPWSVRFTLYVVSLLSTGLALGLITTIYCWQQTTVARQKLEMARKELLASNESLESRVAMRTVELDSINRKLVDEAAARTLVERDQKRTLERLEDAQSLAQMGSFVLNTSSNTLAWSKQCFMVHGLSYQESAPSLDEYLMQVHEEDRSAFKSYLQKAALLDEREEFRYRITLRSGELRWVRSLLKSCKSAEGLLIAIEGVVQNVTDQVIAEEQLHHSVKMEVAGHLAGGIAHDLNNTLAIVKMNCFLLSSRQGVDSPETLELHLNAIESAADKSALLTRQLLTFSRKQVIRPVLLNVNTTIRSFSGLLAKLLCDRIEITFDLAEDIKDVRLDQGQLEQLLMNLMLNARDAIQGIGLIRVSTTNFEVNSHSNITHWNLKPKCGSYVCLTVTDTGCGIPTELIHKIFEPFFSTKNPENGTGLGLAVVHGIVRQNNGGILVQSQQDQGTTFKLLIPVANKNDSDIDAGGSNPFDSGLSPTISTSSDTGKSILLVDDEPSVCKPIELALNRLGYRVTTSFKATEAIALATEGSVAFELLLTDYSMPHMSGIELANEIRKQLPHLPVIIMSGFLNEEAFRDMPVGLVPVFLQKPFSIQDLISSIERALRQSAITG